MIKTFTIQSGDKPTEEMYRELERAQKEPIVYDDDCPKLSPALIKAFESAVVQRNRRKGA